MDLESITTAAQLDELLSIPNQRLIKMFRKLDGDVMILGINGKMGLTLGRLALNAIQAAGVDKQVIGVSRFSNPASRAQLENRGIKTIVCDLLDAAAVNKLPQVKNIIFMAGRKFGTEGQQDLTWAMNTLGTRKKITIPKSSFSLEKSPFWVKNQYKSFIVRQI